MKNKFYKTYPKNLSTLNQVIRIEIEHQTMFSKFLQSKIKPDHTEIHAQLDIENIKPTKNQIAYKISNNIHPFKDEPLPHFVLRDAFISCVYLAHDHSFFDGYPELSNYLKWMNNRSCTIYLNQLGGLASAW